MNINQRIMKGIFMNKKRDITMRSEYELSLLVFNDEFLYNRRFKQNFTDILDELFIYTGEQLDVLNEDLKADLNEEL